MNEILITSTVLIAVILLVRMIFQGRVSQRLIYGVWLLVAVHLLIPVQLYKLDFSVLKAAQPLIQAISDKVEKPIAGMSREEAYSAVLQDYLVHDQTAFIPEVQEQLRQDAAIGIVPDEQTLAQLLNAYPQQELLRPEVQQQVEQQLSSRASMPTLGQITAVVWIVGLLLMAEWFILINLRFRRKLGKSRVPAEDLDCPIPVYISAEVASPCLVGTFKPAIYLTPESAAYPVILRHVLTHELTHWRHFDHVWSMVRCICLCIYWFHPLAWLAAYYSRRDCELACDEGSILRLGEEERITYGKSLLDVVSKAAAPVMLLHTATSMNETKRELKRRVKLIAKRRKISAIAVGAMAAICIIAAGCCCAAPAEVDAPQELSTNQAIVIHFPTEKCTYFHEELISRERYTYDQRAQLIKVEKFYAQEETPYELREYTYDVHGNLRSERKVSYEFDNDQTYYYDFTYGHDGTIVSLDAQHENPNIALSPEYYLAYDAAGRFIKASARDEAGNLVPVYELSYDADGRLLQIRDSRMGQDFVNVVAYTYDAQGRLESRQRTSIVHGVLHTQPADTWEYPAVNQVRYKEFTFTYEDGFLASILHKPYDSAIHQFSIDEFGNVTQDNSGASRCEYTYAAIEIVASDADLYRPYLGPFDLRSVLPQLITACIEDPLKDFLQSIDIYS